MCCLLRSLRIQQGAAKARPMLIRLRAAEAALREVAFHDIEVVHMQLHGRLEHGATTDQVAQPVGGWEDVAEAHQATNDRRSIMARQDLHGQVPAGCDAVSERLQDDAASPPRDMLQDNVGMHQIELSLDARQAIVGTDERDIQYARSSAISFCLGDHRGGDINTHHLIGAASERNHQTTDTAAEVQGRPNSVLDPSFLEYSRNVLLSRGKKLGLGITAHPAAAEFLSAENPEIRVGRTPLLPVAVCAHLAFPISYGTPILLKGAASVFTHADTGHLVANLAALAIVGPLVWRTLGWWRFSALFLLVGTLANTSAAALLGRPVVGASGAVAGVMAAHLVLSPRSRLSPLIAMWIAVQGVFAAVALDFGGVAWCAHLVGAALGVVFALATRPVRSRTAIAAPN